MSFVCVLTLYKWNRTVSILSCLGFSSLKIMFSSWSMLFRGAQLARVWMCVGFVGPGFWCPWLSALHTISLHEGAARYRFSRRVFAHEPGLRRDAFPGTGPLAQGQAPLQAWQATPACSPIPLPRAQATLPGASHSCRSLILAELVFPFPSVWRALETPRCGSRSAAL